MKYLKLSLYLLVGLTLLNFVYADCPTCTTGLVSYWDLDGNFLDSAGSNDGTGYGGPTLTTGMLGGAYSFDGDEYVGGVDTIWPIGTNSKSVSFWAYPIVSEDRYYFAFSYGASSSTNLFAVGITSGSANWIVTQYGAAVTSGVAQLNTWTHIVVTYDGSTYTIYENGVYANAGGMSTNTISDGEFRIGSHIIADSWKGKLDEVSLWNRALTPTEISELYNSGAGLEYPFSDCGNGGIDAGEICDDADANDVDVCSNTCEDNSPTDSKFDSVTDYSTSEDLTSQSDFELTLNSGNVKWNVPVHILNEDLDSNVNLGSDFVSLNLGNLNETFNSSANVSFTVAGCDSYQIYYSPSGFFSDFASLKADGSTVACDPGICTNVQCVGTTLSFTALHFDGFGGEGDPPAGGVPEFNFFGILLIVAVAGLGMYLISKKN